jgi:hypothetical protein
VQSASIALGIALVVVVLALCGLDSDLPIYAGLGGSLIAYVVVSLKSGRSDTLPAVG